MERPVTITQKLLELIGDREVRAALFTTYTFEPDFFELEVIPMLLDRKSAYSEDERVKRFMVRENLRDAGLPIDVYYDSPMFRKSGSCSPEMEYLCHGVDLGNRAFHGKVNMVLVRDTVTNKESLLFGAGSNNLSRAGWWDNIECQHWEEIQTDTHLAEFKDTVLKELEFLNDKREFSGGNTANALDRIRDFVSNCNHRNGANQVHYFSLNSVNETGRFSKFLKQGLNSAPAGGKWKLEIISPFFADDVLNIEHETFFDMGVEKITLLLPADDEGAALCKDEYYEHIKGQDRIHWGWWNDSTARSLELTGDNYRPLHAKIYHFYHGNESWVFVGSVNFTFMAMHRNVEAGFLVKQANTVALLEPFTDDNVVEKFANLNEVPPGEEHAADEAGEIPKLYLRYDWVAKCLTGRTSKRKTYEIEIVGPEGEAVIAPWVLTYQTADYIGDVALLELALKNGSMVKVRGCKIGRANRPRFPEHTVLLQQIGWSHKQLDLPSLTPTQILAIYAGMSVERRQMMLIDAKIRALVLAGNKGELTVNSDDIVIDQFFCEYAEIFRAFGQLHERLTVALDGKYFNQVDYYLTGSGVDSLPSLLSEVLAGDKGEGSLATATCYLLCLSALQIYDDQEFNQRPNVAAEAEKLKNEIQSLKIGDRLVLEDNSAQNREQFFAWFEEEFFRDYSVLGKA
jgi:hypothetical protein